MNASNQPATSLDNLLKSIVDFEDNHGFHGSNTWIRYIASTLQNHPEWVEPVVVFVADNLDQFSDNAQNTLWRYLKNKDPANIGVLIEALIQDTHGLSAEKLIELITQGGTIPSGSALAMLTIAQNIDDDSYLQVLDVLTTLCMDGAMDGIPVSLNTLESIAKHHRLDGLGFSERAHYNIFHAFVVCANMCDNIAQKQSDERRQNAQQIIQLLLAHGADMERPVMEFEQTSGTARDVALASPLHLACHTHISEHSETAILALLDCGADWEKVLAHRNAPKGPELALMERHPRLIKAKLEHVAQTHQTTQSNPRAAPKF